MPLTPLAQLEQLAERAVLQPDGSGLAIPTAQHGIVWNNANAEILHWQIYLYIYPGEKWRINRGHLIREYERYQ